MFFVKEDFRFYLIGVAAPSDLIKDTQITPFNIGKRIDLTDFTFEEVMPLAKGLKVSPDESQQVLRWVLKWTGGHPYLTQRLCRVLSETQQQFNETNVDRAVASAFFGERSEEDHNLQFVRDMLTKRAPDETETLKTYRQIRRGKNDVRDDEKSLIRSHLKLSGVVRRENEALHLRNAIYQTVFDEEWIRKHLPINWWKRVYYAAVVFIALLLSLSGSVGVYALMQREEANKERDRALESTKELQVANDKLSTTNQELEVARKNLEDALRQAQASRKKAEELAELAGKQTAVADQQRLIADDQRRLAERNGKIAFSREMAAHATALPPSETDLKLLLARKAHQEAETSQAEDALRLTLLESLMRSSFRGHRDKVFDAAFSPDGKLIVTASGDNTARVWETATGRTIAQLQGHTDIVSDASFSPDGKFMVTASWDRTARVWEAVSGRSVALLQGHSGAVYDASFSPDGKLIVTASGDNTARIYANVMFAPIEEILRLTEERMGRKDFSPQERVKYLHEAQSQTNK